VKYLLAILLLSTSLQAKPNARLIYGLTSFGLSVVGANIVPCNKQVGLTTFASGFVFVGVVVIIDFKKHKYVSI
jgi:hypothetical protein